MKTILKAGRDVNGNKVLRVKVGESRAFSVQTLGNLPQTHRNGICAETVQEPRGWVMVYGTATQKAQMLFIA